MNKHNDEYSCRFTRSFAPLMVPLCFGLSALVAGAAPAGSDSGSRFAATAPRMNTGKAVPARTAKPAKAKAVAQMRPLAKYEPPTGAYIGAALDTSKYTDPSVRTEQITAAQLVWEKKTNKKHAIYVHFLEFPHDDGSFPTWDNDPQGWSTAAQVSDAAAATGAAPMLTLEPKKLELFFTNWKPGAPGYDATEAFAKGAGKWGKPLFIRFGHEMNGSWYPWSEWSDKNRNQRRDPGEETGNTALLYRRAYRNVAAMFRQHAPNAALVWCPNSGLLGGQRRDVYRPWYPGDDVVDWVGLDVYERGWTMPMPGAHLWGGQFAFSLTHDAADDGSTPQNESVNFYQTFAVEKNKPMMLCETGATLSYRTDLSADERMNLTNQWKAGYWNSSEYGWMQSVYGTSWYKEQPLLQPIDKQFPLLKAVVWFQIAKREYIPTERTTDGKTEIFWFDNSWADYRVGGAADEGATSPYAEQELDLYRKLIAPGYFLSNVR